VDAKALKSCSDGLAADEAFGETLGKTDLGEQFERPMLLFLLKASLPVSAPDSYSIR
jgi:hypothetical protein